jgi:hypothetical protein
MDMAPTIIICTPIFLPVAKAYGVDPVHFGVILILNARHRPQHAAGRRGAVRRLRGGQDHRVGVDALDLAVLWRRHCGAGARHLCTGAFAPARVFRGL